MPVYSTSMLPTSAPMSHTVWDELLHLICVGKLLHPICVYEYLHPIPIRSNVPMLPTSASMLHTVWGELLHPIISYRSLAEEFHRYFQLIYICFLISPSQKTFRPSTLKFLSAPCKGISFTLSAVKFKKHTIISLSFIHTETCQ